MEDIRILPYSYIAIIYDIILHGGHLIIQWITNYDDGIISCSNRKETMCCLKCMAMHGCRLEEGTLSTHLVQGCQPSSSYSYKIDNYVKN